MPSRFLLSINHLKLHTLQHVQSFVVQLWIIAGAKWGIDINQGFRENRSKDYGIGDDTDVGYNTAQGNIFVLFFTLIMDFRRSPDRDGEIAFLNDLEWKPVTCRISGIKE